MIKSVFRTVALGVLVAAIAGAPVQLRAQTTNPPAAAKKSAAAKKDSAAKQKGAHPFRGKLAAVDKSAKTIKVGESVYHVTSDTKFTKDGNPATMNDGVVGEFVSGFVKPAEDGKMNATTVHFGAPAKPKASDKKRTQ